MRDNAVSVLSAVVANWIITSSLCCDSSFEFLGHRAKKSHLMLHRVEIVTKKNRGRAPTARNNAVIAETTCAYKSWTFMGQAYALNLQ